MPHLLHYAKSKCRTAAPPHAAHVFSFFFLPQSKLTNKDEFVSLKNNLIFQNGISSWGGTRKLPYAFTEQGLAMLSGILNSDIAIDVNISIMRAFVAIRRMTATKQKHSYATGKHNYCPIRTPGKRSKTETSTQNRFYSR